MSYLVLARKWRPQVFEEVVGQKHITQTLQNAIIGNRLAHAFLFTGVRGVGKTSVARILAKALNCEKGPGPIPCNQCPSCKEISEGRSIDVLEIDGASNTGVDDVRELRENVKYLPSKGKYKVYIIDEVHMLSTSAFNALLKTLEEPPSHIIFIFATTEPHKIPETILSRCQRFDFKRIPLKGIKEQIERISSQEGIKISERSLSLIAKEAEGSMRDAQSILDQVISFAGTEVKDEQVIEILGIMESSLLYGVSQAIMEKDFKKCLQIMDNIYNSGYDLKQFYQALIEHLRNLLMVKIEPQASFLVDLSEGELVDLGEQASKVSLEEIHQLFQILFLSEEEINRSSFPKLALEIAIIRMVQLKPVRPLEELLERIKDLEERFKEIGDIPEKPLSLKEESREKVYLSPQEDYQQKEESLPSELSQPEVSLPISNSPELWEKLVAFAKKKKPLLASILEQGKLLKWDEESIEIGFNKNSIFLDSLQEVGNKTVLKKICQEFFQKEIKLNISSLSSASAISLPPSEEEGEEKRRERLKKEALNNPITQEVLKIFGGKVSEVKIESKRR